MNNPSLVLLDAGLEIKAANIINHAAESTTSTSNTTTVKEEDEGKKEECLVMITSHEDEEEISSSADQTKGEDHEEEDCGRERLKRHRVEMAGRVWIPEIWGQETFLKDWIDCADFDACLVPKGLVLAREALVQECRRPNSGGLQIENRC